MNIKANNSHEASKQILRVIYSIDYKYTSKKASNYGFTFVYYSPSYAQFSFEQQQRKNCNALIKRYGVIDAEDVITITAHKYSFTQIALGAILKRKFMTQAEFFEIAREHFDWIK